MDKLPSEVHAVESRVQIDGKCVTSRGPGTAMEYSVVLVEQLYGKEKAEEVAGPMVGIAFNIACICQGCILFAVHCIDYIWLKIHIFIMCSIRNFTVFCCFCVETTVLYFFPYKKVFHFVCFQDDHTA